MYQEKGDGVYAKERDKVWVGRRAKGGEGERAMMAMRPTKGIGSSGRMNSIWR